MCVSYDVPQFYNDVHFRMEIPFVSKTKIDNSWNILWRIINQHTPDNNSDFVNKIQRFINDSSMILVTFDQIEFDLMKLSQEFESKTNKKIELKKTLIKRRTSEKWTYVKQELFEAMVKLEMNKINPNKV